MIFTVALAQFDKRGEVWRIDDEGKKEYLLIHTKAGKKRGGETHHKIQHGFVLRGEMILYNIINSSTISKTYKTGDSFIIQPEIVHWMEAKEDTTHIETITEYVDSCPIINKPHNKHYVPEIRAMINV